MHASTATVQAALVREGAHGQVRELDTSTRTAAEAAAALGCPVGAIANSLVFLADEQAVLVLASGRHRVDTRHLATCIGAQTVSRAAPEQVREATGQPIGGVSPVGHPEPVPTYIDVALQEFPVLWAAAGTPRSVFPTDYQELLRICHAHEVTVTADG